MASNLSFLIFGGTKEEKKELKNKGNTELVVQDKALVPSISGQPKFF